LDKISFNKLQNYFSILVSYVNSFFVSPQFLRNYLDLLANFYRKKSIWSQLRSYGLSQERIADQGWTISLICRDPADVLRLIRAHGVLPPRIHTSYYYFKDLQGFSALKAAALQKNILFSSHESFKKGSLTASPNLNLSPQQVG
jgi:hypothetical protein